MAEKVLMLALSPTMEEGKIAAWKVKEGDAVKNGTLLCEVETDKAVMEYESPVEGTLLKIVLEAGRSAKVGDLIAVVGKTGEDIAGLLKDSATSAPAAPAERKSPEAAKKDAPPPERTLTAEAPPSPAKTPPTAGSGAASAPAEVLDGRRPLGYGGYPKSSPLARRLAREKGLDIRSIAGSGPEGRVVKRDVLRFAASGAGPVTTVLADGKPEAPFSGAAPVSAPHRPVLRSESLPVTGMRAAIAKRLTESASAPHFFLRVAVAMDGLLEARTRLNAESKDKLSLNAFFLKFAAEAIKRHPRINSTWKDTVIEIHGSVDIGLAVALPDGLITPIVRDCGNKGILEIDRELSILVDKARRGALKPEEYSGATFSISNLGTYGIEEFTAVINPPGSAILALGETRKEAVVTEENEVEIRRMMRMTLTCDHRTIDGAVGAAFLKDLKILIEDPVRAFL